MTAPWWPPAAPVAPHRVGELTSRELQIMIEFAESGICALFGSDGADVGDGIEQLAGFAGMLRAEADERRRFMDQFTARAKAGKP